MKIGIVKERREGELRCAVSPDTVKKYVGLGAQVAIETGAGLSAAITDDAFKNAGAEIVGDSASALSGADLVLKVQRPEGEELNQIKRGAVLAAIEAGMDVHQRGYEGNLVRLSASGPASLIGRLREFRVTKPETLTEQRIREEAP